MTLDLQVVPCGDDALRVMTSDPRLRHTLAEELRRMGVWREVVPGRREVTVAFDPVALSFGEAKHLLEGGLPKTIDVRSTPQTTILLEATFGGACGPDLEDLAATNGLTAAAFVGYLTRRPFIVDMMGFTPGFAYLEADLPGLTAGRLASPRSRVVAGSIGLITGQLGLYALDGPGGWPLIGRVVVSLFDAAADRPFRLSPGQGVQLVDVTGS